MSDRVYTVLILCTGNSARSIMAEALFNVLGKGHVHAYSAGSHSAGKVNPFAAERCTAIAYDTSTLRSKSWDEFAAPGAPQMDFVITVCAQAAGEACPIWPGTPLTAHWGCDDPAAFEGTDDEKRKVFDKVFRQIMNRVTQFVNLHAARARPQRDPARDACHRRTCAGANGWAALIRRFATTVQHWASSSVT